MDFKITFLGTGSAVPTAKKNHVGTLFSFGSQNILIDCGEGTQRQLKIAKISPTKLTHLLITHWHGDHTLGIPGLLETLNMSEYSKTLHIYGPKETKRNLKLFESIYGNFRIKHKIHEITQGIVLNEKDFIIESAPMKHGKSTLAYSIFIKDKLRLDKKKINKLKLPNSPLLGILQQGKSISHPKTKKKIKSSQVTYLEKGKKVTIIMDTSMNNNAIKLAKNSDLLISEASYTEKEKARALEYKHLTSKDAATIAKKSKSKALILTHISQRYDKNTKPILQEAKTMFKKTKIVNDFDKITL